MEESSRTGRKELKEKIEVRFYVVKKFDFVA
jgi:hypothetical protein